MIRSLSIIVAVLVLSACQNDIDKCVAAGMKSYDLNNPDSEKKDRAFFESQRHLRCLKFKSGMTD